MNTATSPSRLNSLPTLDRLASRLNTCCYDSIREIARQLDFSAGVVPDIDSLNRLAASVLPAFTTASGKALVFAVPETGPTALGYEARIFATGAVPTRPGNIHDLFNALVWLTFPLAKAALNERHIKAQCAITPSPNRSPAQDALTLFDECGVIVASDRPDLLALIAGFQWKQLFWQRRHEIERHMKFFLFGHGLMEQLLNPYIGLMGKALLITVEPAWLQAAPDVARRHIDATCRTLIASAGTLSHGGDPVPLPVLGIPGWAAENRDEAYYDNARYFRPGRSGLEKRLR
jgi:Protein of unknown function (DUF3025)